MTAPPFEIDHQLDRSALTVRAVVETPAGSRGKFTFDPSSGLFALGKLLPIGLAMPFDFGFVPSTRGGDGDPLDLLILSEVELPTGCLVTVRLLGAIEAEQAERGSGDKPIRNDRLVARLTDSRRWAEIERMEELGPGFARELNRFFATYKDLRGQDYTVLSIGGPDQAADLIAKWAP